MWRLIPAHAPLSPDKAHARHRIAPDPPVCSVPCACHPGSCMPQPCSMYRPMGFLRGHSDVTTPPTTVSVSGFSAGMLSLLQPRRGEPKKPARTTTLRATSRPSASRAQRILKQTAPCWAVSRRKIWSSTHKPRMLYTLYGVPYQVRTTAHQCRPLHLGLTATYTSQSFASASSVLDPHLAMT